MKEKGEAYKKPATMKKFICRKTAVQVSSLQLLHHLRFRHDLAYLVAGDCWLAGMIITWIVKSFDEDVDYYGRWQKSKNWKTSISMRLLRQAEKWQLIL